MNIDLKNKNIIVFGLGISGKSAIKALSNLGAKVLVYDDRDHDEIMKDIYEISEFSFDLIHEDVDIDWSEIFCVIKSPGIRLDNDLIKTALKNNIEVISEIELAYRLFGGDNFVAITGTNGKTTVTSMTAHLLNEAGIKAKVVGNIGVGLLWEMTQNKDNCIYVLELSSFQLASVDQFRAKINIITNITPDHLDWHGTFLDYKNSKLNLIKNLENNDVLILNMDDPELSNIKHNNVRYFSLKHEADAFLKNRKIFLGDSAFDREDLILVGDHNVANAMAAILAAKEVGASLDEINKGIKTFSPIEHRIEFVAEIDGVSYYNDSKGTNIDSTRMALKGFDEDIVLIAGGYDKHVKFESLFENVSNIKSLLLFGENKKYIEEAAIKAGIKDITSFSNLDDCMDYIFREAYSDCTVLFSPASASWDMYTSYEERGKHFKEIVNKYEKSKR